MATLLSFGIPKEAISVDNQTQNGYTQKYTIAGELVVAHTSHSISIIPGDSLNDIYRADVARRDAEQLVAKKKREVIARENNRDRMAGNSYAEGYCTWYVASKVKVPSNWGNAINWPVNSETPKIGGIVKTNEDRYGRGHVAYIESIRGDDITVSEMNVKGWNIKSTRQISIHNSHILGFINLN